MSAVTEADELADERYLVLKRGLYFRPNDCGYTGLKREAGRYRAAHADPASGELAVHEDEAPEYSPNCYEETKLADKDRQIAELQATVVRLEAEWEWPDIGVEPLTLPRPREIEETKERLRSAMAIQQPHVPNGTALVWRTDLMDAHHWAIRIEALAEVRAEKIAALSTNDTDDRRGSI